jgi:hypothetical protein
MSRRRDPRIKQLKAIIRAAALGPGGKSRPVKGSVEEVTGTISGEHTSCSISTMRTGRQAKNQQPGRSIAERLDGFTPVVPIEKCAAFDDSDFVAVGDQAGAELALHHLPIQRDKVFLAAFTGFWAVGLKH